ncbi:MAG: ZIP family metal transporter [Thioalkalispiraceae bacterium]|jgi:ZIP family zinc transporter
MSQASYLVIAVLALLSGLTTLLGVALAIHVSRSSRSIAFGIGFSTGIMLLVSFLELIPAAISSSSTRQALIAVITGACLIAFLHWLIPHTHLFKEKGQLNVRMARSAYLVAFGLILHDIPEGFAMANSFLTSPSLGVFVALAIALHNIPEEFAIAVPAATLHEKSFLYKAAFFSGLAEPAGAALGLYAAYLSASLVPVFLGFAAGAMIFVSLHELVPMARRYGHIPVFVVGIVMSVLIHAMLTLLFPE